MKIEFANNITKRGSRVKNYENHAHFTRPAPLNDIVGEFKNRAHSGCAYASNLSVENQFANNILM